MAGFYRLPLLHFVTGDLPANTIAPELDDTNAAKALRADVERTGEDRSAGAAVTEETLGVYLAWLVAEGFMPLPPEGGNGKPLPNVKITGEQREAMKKAGGRGKVV